jgi:hypothetical protein
MENKKGYLPSWQFMATAAAIIVVVGLVFIAEHFPKTGQLSYTSPDATLQAEAVQNLIAGQSDVDTDHDGLKDWEEALWKTDPNKADTDGDGTPDGEEVKEGRDPAKKGPNDKLSNSVSAGTSVSASGGADADLNATDKLARQFFTAYTQAKDSGLSMGSTTQSQIISAALSQRNLVTPTRQYSLGELNVSNDVSITALKNYMNALGDIEKNHAYDPSQDTEMIIFNKAVIRNDKAEISNLTPIISRYNSELQALLKIPVPKDLQNQHLAYTNAIGTIAQDVAAMQNVFTDPVQALAAFSEYAKTVQTIPSINATFGTYYSSKNIVFSSNESGYYFLNLYK